MSEWIMDETGRRYRMVGNIKEYEMMVMVDGFPVPESQVKEFHARQSGESTIHKMEQAARAAELNTGKSCPMGRISCRTDCALYFRPGGCSMTHYAKEGQKCPYNNQPCRSDCGQYKGRK